MVSGCPIRETGGHEDSQLRLIEARGQDGLRLLTPEERQNMLGYIENNDPDLYGKLTSDSAGKKK